MERGLKEMISGIHQEDQHGCLITVRRNTTGRHMRSRDMAASASETLTGWRRTSGATLSSSLGRGFA